MGARHSRRRTAMERRWQRHRALARRVGWLLQLSKELDHRSARATDLLQAMVAFVGDAPAVRAPDDGATNSTAELERERLGQECREAERLAAEQERQRKDQERCEADRLVDLEQLKVEQEQESMYQERMEAERLAELNRRVE